MNDNKNEVHQVILINLIKTDNKWRDEKCTMHKVVKKCAWMNVSYKWMKELYMVNFAIFNSLYLIKSYIRRSPSIIWDLWEKIVHNIVWSINRRRLHSWEAHRIMENVLNISQSKEKWWRNVLLWVYYDTMCSDVLTYLKQTLQNHNTIYNI